MLGVGGLRHGLLHAEDLRALLGCGLARVDGGVELREKLVAARRRRAEVLLQARGGQALTGYAAVAVGEERTRRPTQKLRIILYQCKYNFSYVAGG